MNKKKVAFFAAWVALLILLVVLINVIGTPGTSTRVTSTRPSVAAATPPPPDKTVLAKNWARVLAQASPVRGSTSAPYTLVEFGDFECPLCGHARQRIETFVSKFPIVNMYFVNRPFTKHPHAMPAAEAALSAASQSKFWPMYDALYAHQNQLDSGHLETYANQIGIDGKKVAADVDNNVYLIKVQASAQFCDNIGVTATPTIVVRNNQNGSMVIARTDDEITKLVSDPGWVGLAKKAAEKSSKVAHE